MSDPLDIYGKAELVDALGVSRQRVLKLQESDPRFPAPAVRLTCGPIWRGPEVREYAANRLRAPSGKGT